MNRPTQPTIFEAQNTSDARRLVAAQAILYSKAKGIFFGRILLVTVLALAAMVTSTTWEASRLVVGGGGGLLLFLLSFIAEAVETRFRLQASATQELFDTRVFQIEWNELNTARPSSAVVAQAAQRYRGGRDANWYDDTKQIHRPFDILACQATNLGWGATMHRVWGWLLFCLAALGAVAIGITWYGLHLNFQNALLSLLVPALAPYKEVVSLIKANFGSSREKEGAERILNNIWDRGMSDVTWEPSIESVRRLQDRIFAFRQTNAYVPNWLDSLFHSRNEAAMRASVSDRVTQARRSGRG